VTIEESGVEVYVKGDTTTGDAVSVYAPGARFVSVVVAVTVWLNPPGPATSIAAGPLGRPVTVTCRLPLART
jgi:hypothetical protein